MALDKLLGCAGENDISALLATLGSHVNNPVGLLDDVGMMLNDNDAVTIGNQRIERGEEFLDVVEMQTRGGFVEDEEPRTFAVATHEEGSQLDALSLAATKRTGALTQFKVAESDILQWFQAALYLAADRLEGILGIVRIEEFHRLVDSHVQHLANILLVIHHFERIALETSAMTFIAN